MRRLLVAIAVALIAGLLGQTALTWQDIGAADLYFPFCGARALIRGVDPYNACPITANGIVFPPNPLTTVLAVLPFLPFGRHGPALVWAVGSGLLAYGLTRDGKWWRCSVSSAIRAPSQRETPALDKTRNGPVKSGRNCGGSWFSGQVDRPPVAAVVLL